MTVSIRWESYPLITSSTHVRTWLQIQSDIQLAANTVDAYGRALEDFLGFCHRRKLPSNSCTREHIALWTKDLSTRRHKPRCGNKTSSPLQIGLSNATIQQRLTAGRLYFDYLVEESVRPDNPVGRGRRVPSRQ